MSRAFSRKTKRQAWRRCAGFCEGTRNGERCGLPLHVGHFVYDHAIAYEFSRDSSLSNCRVICDACDDEKTYAHDIPAIRRSDRIHDRHIGALTSRRPMPCGRHSKQSRTMSGTVVERLTLGDKLARLAEGKYSSLWT